MNLLAKVGIGLKGENTIESLNDLISSYRRNFFFRLAPLLTIIGVGLASWSYLPEEKHTDFIYFYFSCVGTVGVFILESELRTFRVLKKMAKVIEKNMSSRE